MKAGKEAKPTRRWIRERRGAITAKFDNFALHDDEDGLKYWLTYECELPEDSPEFLAALDAFEERAKQLQARRRRR